VRLDRRSIPYRVLENGLRLGGIILFGVISSGSAGSPLAAAGIATVFVVVGLVLAVGWEVARYRRYSYELTTDTFDIRSGILSRREREIPYERIQNVDIAQNILQRALDIAEVRIETAGGSGSEAHLRYVGRAEADRLQNEVSRRKGDTTGTGGTTARTPDRDRLFALSDREHVVLGLVSADLRLLGLVSVALSAFAPQLARQFAPQFDIVSLFGPVLALVGIVGFWFVSGALQILRYYGFTLTRQGDELRYERGLLQRYTGTIPLSKVQALTLRENVLARAVGYASLSIQTAGRGGSGDGDGSNVESAVPIAARDRALGLAREIEPFGGVSFERPPKRARTRYAVRYAIGLAGLTGLLWIVRSVTDLFSLWYLPLAGLPVVPVAAHLAWAHKGYYLGEEHVVTRNGFWRRRTMIVPYDRVQTVFDSQTLFQRRRRLGTVTVDTAGGGGLGSGDAVAVDIDVDTARDLRETVARRFQRALATGGARGT
jgi:putative membrane protein